MNKGAMNNMAKFCTENEKTLNLPQAATTLLPHQPPLCLVESLIARAADRSVASARLPASGHFADHGQVLPEYFIELIAQTAALGNCYDGVAGGMAKRDGMLVGVDAFSLIGQSKPGERVTIETDVTMSFGAVTAVHGEVFAEKRLLAAADLKVWEDLDSTKSGDLSALPAFSRHQSARLSLMRQKGAPDIGDSLAEALSACCRSLPSTRKDLLCLEVFAECNFPENFIGFIGHFPGNPILPAFLQVAAIRFIAEHSLKKRLIPTRYEKIKFKDIIRPQNPISAKLTLKKDGAIWGGNFSLVRATGELVTTGTVGFSS
jgi:3-hydroxyacyl-[acyl-carrier-protein] dehydratase